jgi:hypothetical protein
MILTDEQLDALARAASIPDLFEGREWTEELHERVYIPLIEAGLVVESLKPYLPDPENFELMHYEATEAGRALVKKTAS